MSDTIHVRFTDWSDKVSSTVRPCGCETLMYQRDRDSVPEVTFRSCGQHERLPE